MSSIVGEGCAATKHRAHERVKTERYCIYTSALQHSDRDSKGLTEEKASAGTEKPESK